MITTTFQRMKRRMWLLGVLCSLMLIAAVIFASLYFAKIAENRQAYVQVYNNSLTNAISLMDTISQSTLDSEMHYRELIGEYGMCCQMSYLGEFPQNYQVLWNELYSASIKLPDEMEKYFAEILASLRAIHGDDPQAGYDMLAEITAEFDKLNYSNF